MSGEVNIQQALLGLVLAVAVAAVTDAIGSARWVRAFRVAIIAGILFLLAFGVAWWANALAWVHGRAGWLAVIAGLLVAGLAAAFYARRRFRTSQDARAILSLITSQTRADREHGYRRLGRLLEMKPMPNTLVTHLRQEALYDGADSTDRAEALQLLRQARRLDGVRELAAVAWFQEPDLRESLCGPLSGVFNERRLDLAPLVDVLERLPIPINERDRNDGIATIGYRLSWAFAAIKNALEHDREPLSDDMRRRLLALCDRFQPLPKLSALHADIKKGLE